MLNGGSKDSFSKLKTSTILLPYDYSAATAGRTVTKRHGNVRLYLIGDRYMLDFLRQTVRPSVMQNDVVHASGVNCTSENRSHLEIKSSVKKQRKTNRVTQISLNVIGFSRRLF